MVPISSLTDFARPISLKPSALSFPSTSLLNEVSCTRISIRPAVTLSLPMVRLPRVPSLATFSASPRSSGQLDFQQLLDDGLLDLVEFAGFFHRLEFLFKHFGLSLA